MHMVIVDTLPEKGEPRPPIMPSDLAIEMVESAINEAIITGKIILIKGANASELTDILRAAKCHVLVKVSFDYHIRLNERAIAITKIV